MTITRLPFLLLITVLTGCAQETYLFENRINPEKLYHTTMYMESESETEYIELESGHQNRSPKSKSSTKMTRIITTQKANKDGQIPALMEYGEIISTSNGNQTQSPISGAMVSGHYSENQFNVREIISDNLDTKTKESLKHTLENVKPDISFPEKPIKIGDSFKNQMPMTIPVQGANPVKIDLIKTFTLKTVQNGMAMLDLKEKIILNTEIEQANVIATGAGFGTVQFDINQGQIINNSSSFTIDLKVKLSEEASISSKIKSKSDITTTLQ